MKKLFWVITQILIVISLVIASSSIALAAVADPDSIDIFEVGAFRNVFEANDMLFIVSYDVSYASPPSLPVEDVFSFNIYDTDGTTLLASRGLVPGKQDYQYGVISIYKTASEVTTLGLTWDANYYVRITGNPTQFTTLTEGVNMKTRAMSPANWIDGSLSNTTPLLLKLFCLNIAEALEAHDGETYIIVAASEEYLNTAGKTIFITAIPGLAAAVPLLFQATSETIPITKSTKTAAGEDLYSINNTLGSTIKASFDGLGNYLGTTGEMVAGLWIFLFTVIIMSIAYFATGNGMVSAIVSIPILLLGTYTGALPMGILFVGAAIVTLYIGYVLFLRAA